MMTDSLKIGFFIGLSAIFLAIPSITHRFGSLLDVLPIRIASVITILAVLAYDRLIALAVFLVITALYIQHHKNDLRSVVSTGRYAEFNDIHTPSAMRDLEHGGHADESYDEMNFVSKSEDQENEFHKVGHSIDEKHVLQTEGLGSKSQSLFPEDLDHAEALLQSNKHGSYD